MAAGLLMGFAASTLAYRYRILQVPHEPLIARMGRELGLSGSQRRQIVRVIRSTRERSVELQREFRRRRRELFRQASRQVRALLTPDQQTRFDRSFVPRRWRHDFPRRRGQRPLP